MGCVISLFHTNLSFVPVSKTTLLLSTLSCLHAPLTLCNRGSKPPLINQIIWCHQVCAAACRRKIYTQNKGWKTCAILLCHCVWNMASMEAVIRNAWCARGCSEGQAHCENTSCFWGGFCHSDTSELPKPEHLCHISCSLSDKLWHRCINLKLISLV